MMNIHQVVVSCLVLACLPTLSRANNVVKAVVVFESHNPGSPPEVDHLAITAYNELLTRRDLQDSSKTLRGLTQRETEVCDPQYCGDSYCQPSEIEDELCSSVCDGCNGNTRKLALFPKDDDRENHLKGDDFNKVKNQEPSNTVMKRRKLMIDDLMGNPCNFQEVTGLAKLNLLVDTGIELSKESYFLIFESSNVIEPNCTTVLAS